MKTSPQLHRGLSYNGTTCIAQVKILSILDVVLGVYLQKCRSIFYLCVFVASNQIFVHGAGETFRLMREKNVWTLKSQPLVGFYSHRRNVNDVAVSLGPHPPLGLNYLPEVLMSAGQLSDTLKYISKIHQNQYFTRVDNQTAPNIEGILQNNGSSS